MGLTPKAMKTASERLPPPSAVVLWLSGSLALWWMYTLVLLQVSGAIFPQAALEALANVVPLALLAVAIHALLKARVMRWSVPAQLLAHLALAVAFALLWYVAVIVLLAATRAAAGGPFQVSAFDGPVFTWQTFQGLILYSTVAAISYAIRGGRTAANVTIVSAPPLERYLTRKGDEIRPVNVRDIVMITGAQDYAEVTTLAGVHLVRMSLAEFEQRLDPRLFLRVHRSTILNFGHLDHVEPAGGGRLIAHMANGATVPVSRAGAQALRQLIV